jgi:hypothetical protein
MRFDHLLQAIARRLLRWGGQLLAWVERSAPVAGEAAPDAREVWAARTTEIPAGAWQRFGEGANRQEVPRPTSRRLPRPPPRKTHWPAGRAPPPPPHPPPPPTEPPPSPAAPQWPPGPGRMSRLAAWLPSRSPVPAKPDPAAATQGVPRPSPGEAAPPTSREPAPPRCRSSDRVPPEAPTAALDARSTNFTTPPSSAPTAASFPRPDVANPTVVPAGAAAAPQSPRPPAMAPIEALSPQRPARDAEPASQAQRAPGKAARTDRPAPTSFPRWQVATPVLPSPATSSLEASALRWPDLPPAPDQRVVNNDTRADGLRLRRLEDEHAAMARGGG